MPSQKSQEKEAGDRYGGKQGQHLWPCLFRVGHVEKRVVTDGGQTD